MLFDYVISNLIQFLAIIFQSKVVKFLENFFSQYVRGISPTLHKDQNVEILHESNNFLVVNKPYDILINSDDDVQSTLQTRLRQSHPHLVNPDLKHEFYFAHRLDYATSGVICIALNKVACAAAGIAFQNRLCSKYYLALVRGHVEKEFMDIVEPIGEDSRDMEGSHRMCNLSETDYCVAPRPAHTTILLLETGSYDGEPASKVMMKPYTGRRHQLRVHCSLIGHPIVGDFTYSFHKDDKPHRMFLHSYRLIIPNDIEHLDIQSRDPFLSNDPVNKWQPTEFFNTVDGSICKKIDNFCEMEVRSEVFN